MRQLPKPNKKIKYNKSALSALTLVIKLKKRGMLFKKGEMEKARLIFENHISYYRLRAYWITLEDATTPNKLFYPDTTFNRVLELYNYDTELKSIISKAISTIEISLRAKFSNLAFKYKSPHFHINPLNAKDMDIFVDCISRQKRSIAQSKDEIFIKHYTDKYSDPKNPPIWSYIEVSSFGDLNSWISNLKTSIILEQFAYSYNISSADVFISFLDRLRLVRNICAHHNRLWNRTFSKRRLLAPHNPLELVTAWNAGRNASLNSYGTFIIIVHIMKSISLVDAKLFLNDFDKISKSYNINLTQLGFHPSWQNEQLFIF